jgi:hypothetical protein
LVVVVFESTLEVGEKLSLPTPVGIVHAKEPPVAWVEITVLIPPGEKLPGGSF